MAWFQYNDGRERKLAVQAKLEKLRKAGEVIEPLVVSGKGHQLSATFWGQAWCRHIETYCDEASRLPRGRSYLRQGNVFNLTIQPGRIDALVAGSELYQTTIMVAPMAARNWKKLVKRCAGQVGSMLDLLAGKLGDDTLRVLTDPAAGLFPGPRQFNFACNCPDWTDMCKHVAAVLYGVGVSLDTNPGWLFTLRDVDQQDLLGRVQASTLVAPGPTQEPGDLAEADLSALFGIDLQDAPAAPPPPAPAKSRKKKSPPP